MASVSIPGTNAGVVRGAAIEVFESHGYKLARRDKELLVFEKKASSMNNVAYGNWTENPVWDRAKVEVEPAVDSLVRLHCTIYLIRDKGAATEEEVKALRRSPAQKLVDEVAARLKPAAQKPSTH